MTGGSSDVWTGTGRTVPVDEVAPPAPALPTEPAPPSEQLLPSEEAVNPQEPVTDHVEVRVPADPAYLAVLRTASAGLAARMDLTLDEIEDLRIAVDEACALLLTSPRTVVPAQAQAGGPTLLAHFSLGEEVLEIRVSGPPAALPERSSFAWAVLEALVGELETNSDGTGSSILLRHRRARRGA